MAKGDPCTIDGCEKPQIAKGWCAMHYARAKKGQDMEAPARTRLPENGKECSWPGCDKPPKRRRGFDGLCAAHYERKRKGEPMDPPIAVKGRQIGKVCSVSWCDRPAAWNGLCRAHGVRKQRGADLDKPFRTSPGQSPAALYPKVKERAERLERELKRLSDRCVALELENRKLKERLDRAGDEMRGVQTVSRNTRKERICLSCGDPFDSDGPGHRICGECKQSVRYRSGGYDEAA